MDGLLVVTPYYNKATASGLLAHYRAVAEAVDLPVILYNVPTRTGVDIPVEVCRELGEIPNIAGIKEAKADLNKISHLIRFAFKYPLSVSSSRTEYRLQSHTV